MLTRSQPVTRRQALQLLALSPWLASSVRASPRRVPRALGYVPWWMAAAWEGLPLNSLERIVLFDSPIEKDGRLVDREWLKRVPALANASAELALTSFGERHFEEVFGDGARRARLLAEALLQLEQPYVSGLHLDIEGYAQAAPEALAGFRAWLAQLDGRRRALGKTLSAFFPASESFAPYDADAAQRVDYWVAQLYDAHWPESAATGPLVTRRADHPVAVPRALARLAALGVAREAVLLSVPLYGWEWPSDSEHPGAAALGRARLLTYHETPPALMPNDRLAATTLAKRHGLRRDAEETPYYAYRDGGQWRQGWFEDLRSLTRKLAPERAQGYAGLAFFPLGYDKGEIVDAMLAWWKAGR